MTKFRTHRGLIRKSVQRVQRGYALAGTLWKSLFLETDMKNDLRLIAGWLTIPVLLAIGSAVWLLGMPGEQLAGPIFHLAFGALQLGMCLTCIAGTVVVMKLLRQRRGGRALGIRSHNLTVIRPHK